jgi:hypothetical protein
MRHPFQMDSLPPAGRAVLQEQTFIEESIAGNNFRAMSKNPLDWDTQRGWYVDLTLDGDYTDAVGERVTVESPSGEWVSATGFQTVEAGLASGVTLLEI